jgi:prepilin peptidase CpaA
MALLLAVLAIGILAAAAASDMARRRISNQLVIGLAAVGLARIALALWSGAAPTAVLADAAGAIGLFALGALAFRFGVVGGGDVKLLAAGALWIGASALYPFLFATALAGGVLGIALMIWVRLPFPGGGVRERVSLPYGVAIATGGILVTVAGSWAA